jgi:hypothetical protein
MENEETGGWVYIICNPAMHKLLKVGFTQKLPELRARELDGTSTFGKHRVAHSRWVNDPRSAEANIHRRLEVYRKDNRREWFSCSLEVAVKMVDEVVNDSSSKESDALHWDAASNLGELPPIKPCTLDGDRYYEFEKSATYFALNRIENFGTPFETVYFREIFSCNTLDRRWFEKQIVWKRSSPYEINYLDETGQIPFSIDSNGEPLPKRFFSWKLREHFLIIVRFLSNLLPGCLELQSVLNEWLEQQRGHSLAKMENGLKPENIYPSHTIKYIGDELLAERSYDFDGRIVRLAICTEPYDDNCFRFYFIENVKGNTELWFTKLAMFDTNSPDRFFFLNSDGVVPTNMDESGLVSTKILYCEEFSKGFAFVKKFIDQRFIPAPD